MRNIFRDGESPELYMNSVEHFRDYVYVEDAVRAYFHIARCSGCHGRVYNLPGAHYTATPDVLREIVEYLGALHDQAQIEAPDSLMARHRWNRSIRIVPSDPNLITISKQHLDGTRIHVEAGFEPQVSFREGLAATAKFYLWYFDQIAPAGRSASIKTEAVHMNGVLPREESEVESGFETIRTPDGLPVKVLRLTPQGAKPGEKWAQRPDSFLSQAALPAA
jgi:dTDP-D-glucose 4,6-dehydratase